jgi:sterol desaturase/sphingolipid hydroxylase (fatty acid hydroxylase superfamily)
MDFRSRLGASKPSAPCVFRGAVAVGLFVLCGVARPDVALGLVALGAVFVVAERVVPIRPQRVFRAGFATDLVHFVVDQVLATALVGWLVVWSVPVIEPLVPNLDHYVRGWWRFVLAAIIGEISGYWGHRAMHRVPCLWRLHAVHHSSPSMDWLAPNRRHVLDTTLGQAASVIPLLALGLRPPEIVSWFVLRRAQGLFVHANLRIQIPVFRWLIATPEFHHWHHSADPAHYDRNFAGQCPLVDRLFGTLHMPRHSWPDVYGLAVGADSMPASYLQRLAWPFASVRPLGARRRQWVGGLAVAGLVGGGFAVAGAIEPTMPSGELRCVVAGLGRVDIGADGIVIASAVEALDLDRTSIRAVGRVGRVDAFRVVRRSGAPLTLSVGATLRLGVALRPITAEGPEGKRAGTCVVPAGLGGQRPG